jgi:hypothetical protein
MYQFSQKKFKPVKNIFLLWSKLLSCRKVAKILIVRGYHLTEVKQTTNIVEMKTEK